MSKRQSNRECLCVISFNIYGHLPMFKYSLNIWIDITLQARTVLKSKTFRCGEAPQKSHLIHIVKNFKKCCLACQSITQLLIVNINVYAVLVLCLRHLVTWKKLQGVQHRNIARQLTLLIRTDFAACVCGKCWDVVVVYNINIAFYATDYIFRPTRINLSLWKLMLCFFFFFSIWIFKL